MEEWRDIKGYEGRYQVSSYGKIRSLDRRTKTKTGSRFYVGKELKQAEHSQGYLVVNLSRNVVFVHRLVAEAFLGISSLFVNHKDSDKKNNKPNNLEYVTNFDNSLHAFKAGIRIGRTKLNKQQRAEIRAKRQAGYFLRELAKEYNMSESAISEVARGTTWRWEHEK